MYGLAAIVRWLARLKRDVDTISIVRVIFRILVAASPEALAEDKGDLWDSGKVASDQSVHIVYQGRPLESRMRCYWKVRVWNTDGKTSIWSEAAEWSMGLLDPDDWRGAQWIGIEKQDLAANKSKDNRTRLPARYLRREFEVNKPGTSRCMEGLSATGR